MNIYFKGNDIVSISGKVWGKIFTRPDGKIEANTVSPLFTLDCIVARQELRKSIEETIRNRFLQLTKQEIRWMRKNYEFAMKCLIRRMEKEDTIVS